MNKFEQLTNYKNLLDQGIITQEEYDEIKNRLLKMGTAHEHLDKGARVVLNTFDTLKKKTDDAYANLKEKGSQWVERELEKERISEENRKIKKEKQSQEKELSRSKRKSQTKKIMPSIVTLIKKILLGLLIAIVILLAVAVVFFFTREKISCKDDQIDSVHGLEYSVSEQFEKSHSAAKNNSDKEIVPEKNTYKIYDSANKLIATYTVEYLGEDIDTDKVKENICRSMYKKKVNQIENGVRIDGYYKKSNLNPRNIITNGITNSRVTICTYNYSSFMISLECNAWNYDSKVCDQLFNSVKFKQYKNNNEAESLDIIYIGSYKVGYEPVQDDFKLEVHYKNGMKSKAEVFNVHLPKRLNENDNSVMIECHGLKSTFHIRPSEKDVDTNDNNQSKKLNKKDNVFNGNGGKQA